jgi:hypothetical protein
MKRDGTPKRFRGISLYSAMVLATEIVDHFNSATTLTLPSARLDVTGRAVSGDGSEASSRFRGPTGSP